MMTLALAVVSLLELRAPDYPVQARQAKVGGEVEVAVDLRPDGSVAAAIAVSGHSLLRAAAEGSASKSRFDCRRCEANVSYRLLYRFVTNDRVAGCAGRAPAVPPSHVQGVVTIVSPPVTMCPDPSAAPRSKARALRCLYLWKCQGVRMAVQ
jgi:hypothetical protein